MSNVHSKLQRGNDYAANKLWSQAAYAYESAFRESCSDAFPPGGSATLETGDGLALARALDALQGGTFEFPDAEAGALQLLRDKLSHGVLLKLRTDLEQESAAYMTAFSCDWNLEDSKPGTRDCWWVIIFHHQKNIGFPTPRKIGSEAEANTEDFPIPIPSGPSAAFLYGEDRRIVRLSAGRCVQLAYARSRLGWANISILLQLYSVSGVLVEVGVQPLRDAMWHGFRAALHLDPKSSWTLSRIGEIHRIIANAWPPSPQGVFTPDHKVEDYVRALCYFKEATDVDPADFWAHAHFGAAIVNVRAFIGAAQGTLLDGLVQAWFPETSEPSHCLLERAYQSLSTAQSLQGNFYPWAQAYSADVLVLQNIVEPKTSSELGTLASALLLSAIWFQPKLASNLFEPSELYENPFYQVGLAYLWCEDYCPAWQFVYVGLGRSFKFEFVPALDLLLGCQLLAHIAHENVHYHSMKQNHSLPKELRSLPQYVLTPPVQIPLQIPEKPFGDSKELVGFICDVIATLGEPMVHRYAGERTVCKINVSLIQLLYCFVDFREILKHHGPCEPGAQMKLDLLIESLEAQLRLKIDPPPSPKPKPHVDPEARERLFARVQGAGLSYQMASWLRPRGSKSTHVR